MGGQWLVAQLNKLLPPSDSLVFESYHLAVSTILPKSTLNFSPFHLQFKRKMSILDEGRRKEAALLREADSLRRLAFVAIFIAVIISAIGFPHSHQFAIFFSQEFVLCR